ncbi:MAG: 3-deoxy-manno-octulosonate cytidylyltransferase [Hyphomicrobiaceae bacterium]|nr:3-deoxy-manno-octulosonate cytidylyltransferase [Hyphomicrobiaceae bacterium]
MNKILIIIPARMKATRLPNKPLLDIHGEPMIVHVWRRATASNVGRVVVATDTEAIAKVISAAGGEVVVTSERHTSGTDRVFEAVNKIDPDSQAKIVVNLQGDLPVFDPPLIASCLSPLKDSAVDIATLASEITFKRENTTSNVVKVVGTTCGTSIQNTLRALYFTRATAPYGKGSLYHHIGIYAYKRKALKRFSMFKPSTLELRENLEQLRALENGMRIDVAITNTIPLSIDTQADLEHVREIFSHPR